MGSTVNVHRPRMKKAEYEILRQKLAKDDYFYNFYLNNCNDYVCREFNINLSTVYKLVKDLGIKLSSDQIKYKNKVAGEQKCLETFGVTNPFASEQVQDRIKEANISKYGVENVFAADEIKNRIRHTTLEKYGVENVSQSAEVKQKIKDTCLAKYGVENYAQTPECREKILDTLLERYGRVDVGCFGSPEHTKALLEKYGTAHVTQLPEVQEKARQTSLEKFGATHYSKTFSFHNRIRKRYVYDGQAFDSLPELATWVYCIDKGIDIKRTPCSFQYVFAEKDYTYFPDFEIAGQLVEIKGDHFFKEDGTMCNPFDHAQNDLYEAKHQCGLQNNVIFWRKADYRPYVEYFKENYDVANYIFKKNDEVN